VSAPLFAGPPEDEIANVLRARRREDDVWGPLTARDIRLLIEESLKESPAPASRRRHRFTFSLPREENYADGPGEGIRTNAEC